MNSLANTGLSTPDRLMPTLSLKRHIIWDWNGTLLNDLDHAICTMNVLLACRGLRALTKEHYHQIFRFPVRHYYDDLGFDFEKESFEDVCEEFVALFMKGVTSCKMVDGMRPLMLALDGKGIGQSVLSATDQENLDRMVEHFELGSLLWRGFGITNKMGRSKLDRGRELLESLSCAPSEIALVGDTDHDLEVGQALGVDVVLVSHGHQSFASLKAKYAKVV